MFGFTFRLTSKIDKYLNMKFILLMECLASFRTLQVIVNLAAVFRADSYALNPK